jgi:hypothetical protein
LTELLTSTRDWTRQSFADDHRRQAGVPADRRRPTSPSSGASDGEEAVQRRSVLGRAWWDGLCHAGTSGLTPPRTETSDVAILMLSMHLSDARSRRSTPARGYILKNASTSTLPRR